MAKAEKKKGKEEEMTEEKERSTGWTNKPR